MDLERLNLATVWETVADTIGDEAAIVQGDRRVSWSDFDRRASLLAGAFAEAGVGKDDKVGLFLYNAPEYLEAYFAALKLRAIPVNINYRYLDDELAYLLDNSDSQVCVFHSSLGDRIRGVRDRLPAVKHWIEVDDGGESVDGALGYEDVLAAATPAERIERSSRDKTILYTGGTTGMPKGVVGKAGGTVLVGFGALPPLFGEMPIHPDKHVETIQEWGAGGRRPINICACPLMHGTGILVGAGPVLVAGGTVVLLDNRKFDPAEIWDTVEREGCNGITLVGDPFSRPMLRALDDDAAAGRSRDLSSMKVITSAGAMFSREVKDGLCEHMHQLAIVDIIASSEASMGQSIHTRDNPAETGTFQINAQTRVVHDDFTDVARDGEDVGMLVVQNADAPEYYKDEEKTANTFRRIGDEIWTHTGDFATVAEDGTVTLLGRGSQVINTAGEKVFAEEVEEIVKTYPAITDCLVVGVPDERFGSRVVGVVSASDGDVDVEAVIAHTKQRLASYKAPKEIVVVDVVPRAPNGKADYATARELAKK